MIDRASRAGVAVLALAGVLLASHVQAPAAAASGGSCRDEDSTLMASDQGSGFQLHAVGGLGLVAYVGDEVRAEVRHNYRFRADPVVATGVATRHVDDRIFSGLENVFEFDGWVSKEDLNLRRSGDHADLHVRIGNSDLRKVDTCVVRVTY